MRNRLLLLVLSLSGLSSFAQQTDTVWFNHKWEKSPKEGSSYYRITSKNGDLFHVTDYYKNGQIQMTGTYLSMETETKNGAFKWYYQNGQKKSESNYINNEEVGVSNNFFMNGVLQKTFVNDDNSKISTGISCKSGKLIYQADSLGNVMVKDGNGHAIETGDLVEEGDYKDGLKHGFWTGKKTEGNFWYKEQYNLGNLISGESNENGILYKYEKADQQPQFKGGFEGFYKFLQKKVTYPAKAVSNKITGKVYLTFVVEKDGTLTEIKVKNSVHPLLDNEAVRVMNNSPKWIPGTQHGLPVRVSYNIPISFNL